jgi:type II secretory pathway pseudopilin PulG
MIVLGVIGIVIGIATPTWIKQRITARRGVCQENLTKIDGAKEQFALETNLSPGGSISWSDLVESDGSGFLKKQPNEPTGGTYAVNALGAAPTCSYNTTDSDHSLEAVYN